MPLVKPSILPSSEGFEEELNWVIIRLETSESFERRISSVTSPRGRSGKTRRRSKMQNQLMDFSNQIGSELFSLLVKRASEDLSEQSDRDRTTAMLGATLIAVAEVLRIQIKQGSEVNKLVNLSSRWLRTLLEPVAGEDTT